jgi:hypothetical protein
MFSESPLHKISKPVLVRRHICYKKEHLNNCLVLAIIGSDLTADSKNKLF